MKLITPNNLRELVREMAHEIVQRGVISKNLSSQISIDNDTRISRISRQLLLQMVENEYSRIKLSPIK